MRRILTSLLVIGIVGAAAFGASRAFFSDTETSKGNVLAAGMIDLEISNQRGSSSADTCKFLETAGGPIFVCNDVKPGDWGEATLGFSLKSNPAWGCMLVDNIIDSDNTCTEPESAAETACTTGGNGELDDNLMLTVWLDKSDNGSCNNTLDPGEHIVINNKALSSFSLGNRYVLPIADASRTALMNTPIQPGDYCIGVKWNLPNTVGNDVQTDSVGGDLAFYVEQSRNNDQFLCSAVQWPGEEITVTQGEGWGPSATITNENSWKATARWGDVNTFEQAIRQTQPGTTYASSDKSWSGSPEPFTLSMVSGVVNWTINGQNITYSPLPSPNTRLIIVAKSEAGALAKAENLKLDGSLLSIPSIEANGNVINHMIIDSVAPMGDFELTGDITLSGGTTTDDRPAVEIFVVY